MQIVVSAYDLVTHRTDPSTMRVWVEDIGTALDCNASVWIVPGTYAEPDLED